MLLFAINAEVLGMQTSVKSMAPLPFRLRKLLVDNEIPIEIDFGVLVIIVRLCLSIFSAADQSLICV